MKTTIEFHRYTANFFYCKEGFFERLELFFDGVKIPKAEINPQYGTLLITLERRAKICQ
jgi:hypothetical protein